ncbi:hypothetical protein FQA47_000550 [Oryzias melastigma]|uniref:Uncharacterized protein n=1 Tax=Oryzias melastigma TaxID=30732 RepID=A0A834CJJ8_ORYME|nr:hypothetical protein FQA47_000550 [Oryzias melastigma]
MKALPPGEEEEEEEEEEEDKNDVKTVDAASEEPRGPMKVSDQTQRSEAAVQQSVESSSEDAAPPDPESRVKGEPEPAAGPSPKKKRVMGPSRPPASRPKDDSGVQLSGSYPEDDPDYSVWIPPAGKLLTHSLRLHYTYSASGKYSQRLTSSTF